MRERGGNAARGEDAKARCSLTLLSSGLSNLHGACLLQTDSLFAGRALYGAARRSTSIYM